MIARLFIGFALFAPALAQAQRPPTPISEALRDVDGDQVPDRTGEVLTVAGRASASAGAFGTNGPSFHVQDATGGLAIRLADREARAVQAGDSVVVTGTFDFVVGVGALLDATVRVVDVEPRLPEPTRYTSDDPEAVEGQLTVVEGIVVGLNDVGAGQALSLSLDDRSLLVAFVFDGSPDRLDADLYDPGDRVLIVGVAGQFDRAPPYQDSYQIYPRSARDVRRAGIPTGLYRRGILIALGLLVLAAGWVTVLRRQVQRRMNQLKRSEDRYRKVVDLASDAIAIHDLQGHHIELNRAAREAIGCGPNDTPPPLFDVVPPEDAETTRAHIARLQHEGHSRAEIRLLCPDGPRYFEFDSQLIELDGAPRVLSLARDVGARHAYEQGLIEAREQAEEMARVKSAFLASMSHEIRTPLTAVIGFAELLRYEVADDQLDLVLAIEAGGTRLLNTLNSVLDLAQMDAGGQTLRPQPLDLVGHVARSLDVLRPMAQSQGLALHFDVHIEVLPASLDPGAFDRVLTNLIGNAIKFTDAGSVTVSLRASGDDIVLSVADTGIGIDAAFLPDLFSEFRQESEGHTRSHEGSGLGLAITQRLVDLMGGTIEVASEKAVGTTFTVTLPRVPERETETTPGTMILTNRSGGIPRASSGLAEAPLADRIR